MTEGDRLGDLADRVAVLAEEVADAAIDLLRTALQGDPKEKAERQQEAVVLERRLTRARRALEKAEVLLRQKAPDIEETSAPSSTTKEGR